VNLGNFPDAVSAFLSEVRDDAGEVWGQWLTAIAQPTGAKA